MLAMGALLILSGVLLLGTPRKIESARADGYEQGLTDGLNTPRPQPTPEPPSFFDMVPDKASCCERLKDAKNHLQTEAANRQNAYDYGLNDGLRIGREDWTALPYDCWRLRHGD